MDQPPLPSPKPETPVETYASLARLIDLHRLAPEISDEQVAEACRVAQQYGVRALIVRPADVENAVRWLGPGGAVIGSTAGFPDGSTTTAAKLYEGRDLLRRGAREIEIVVNTGKLISREFQYVEMELLQMSKSCHEAGAQLTAVLRNNLLAADLQIIATRIARRVEADYLSLTPSAADFDRIRPLLKDAIGLKAETEASSLDQVLTLREWGCTRIGCREPGPVLDAWRAHLERNQAPS
jgi:deoxyribose-phosphate aldolase